MYEEKQPSRFNDDFITIYYYLPNITRSLRVSIFHCLECFFSVCSSCFNIPYNVSFTHLQTFSTTLAMKSKIENRYFFISYPFMLKNYMKSYNALWNWIITFDSVMICNVIISCDHIQVEWVFYCFFHTVDNYRNGYRKIVGKYFVIFM